MYNLKPKAWFSFYCFSLLLVYSCRHNTKYTFSPHSDPQDIIYTGQILDYNKDLHPISIKLWYRQFCCQTLYSAAEFLDNEGNFEFRLGNNIAQDYNLNYADQHWNFLSLPDDSIHFTLFLKDSGKTNSNQGLENSEERKLIVDKLTSNSDLVNSSLEISEFLQLAKEGCVSFSKLTSPGELKEAEQLVFDTELLIHSKLDSFFRVHHISDPLIMDWARQDVNYSIKFSHFLSPYQMILQTTAFSKRDSIIALLPYDPIEFDEGFKSVYNSHYIRFLHMVEFPISWKKTQQIRALQKEKDFDGIIDLKKNTFKNEFADSQYETMQSRYLIWAMDRKSHAEVIDKHIEDFLLNAHNPMYTKAVSNKYAELIGDVDLDNEVLARKLMDIPIHVDHILPEILSKFKNKVIVLDFWGTWCGPCISEFRNGYPDLISKYKNEEIVFVFLASKSPENLWKKMVSELPFYGQHILMNDEQNAVMEKIFSIQGIPHHVVIDQNGNVYKNKAPGPTHGLEEFIKEVL